MIYNWIWNYLKKKKIYNEFGITNNETHLLSPALETSWRSSLETRFVPCSANEVGGVEIVAKEAGLVVEIDRLKRREHRRRGRGWGCAWLPDLESKGGRTKMRGPWSQWDGACGRKTTWRGHIGFLKNQIQRFQ
jgi:hypothetical protein